MKTESLVCTLSLGGDDVVSKVKNGSKPPPLAVIRYDIGDPQAGTWVNYGIRMTSSGIVTL